MAEPIRVAQSKEPIFLLSKMANRHGWIAGATGTGKTVTLQTLAENFSARGVPVFMADVKGDLAGLSQPGANNPKISSSVLAGHYEKAIDRESAYEKLQARAGEKA